MPCYMWPKISGHNETATQLSNAHETLMFEFEVGRSTRFQASLAVSLATKSSRFIIKPEVLSPFHNLLVCILTHGVTMIPGSTLIFTRSMAIRILQNPSAACELEHKIRDPSMARRDSQLQMIQSISMSGLLSEPCAVDTLCIHISNTLVISEQYDNLPKHA